MSVETKRSQHENTSSILKERIGKFYRAGIFPGQGSQEVGMCKEIVGRYPELNAFLDDCDTLLGQTKYPLQYSIKDIMFNGPKELLDRTRYAQLAIFIQQHINWMLDNRNNPDKQPTIFAGNSLGQINALVAAGKISFADGLRLVNARAFGMQIASNNHPGGLISVLMKDNLKDGLYNLVRKKGQKTQRQRQQKQFRYLIHLMTKPDSHFQLYQEADNAENQVVIAGLDVHLNKAQLRLDKLKKFGIRYKRLAVSGAFHTPLMTEALPYIEEVLNEITINETGIAVIANSSLEILRTADQIKKELIAYVTKPVRWRETVDILRKLGVKEIHEYNSKGTLSKMMEHKGAIAGTSIAAGAIGLGVLFYFHQKKQKN